MCWLCNKNQFGEFRLKDQPAKESPENVFEDTRWIDLTVSCFGGQLRIYAKGANTCGYEPKFCLECGRRLRTEDWEIDHTWEEELSWEDDDELWEMGEKEEGEKWQEAHPY